MFIVCHLSETHPQPTPSDFVDAVKVMTTDSKSSMLHGMPLV